MMLLGGDSDRYYDFVADGGDRDDNVIGGDGY